MNKRRDSVLILLVMLALTVGQAGAAQEKAEKLAPPVGGSFQSIEGV